MAKAQRRYAARKRRLSVRGVIVIAAILVLLVLPLALGWIRLTGVDGAPEQMENLSASSPYRYTGNGFVYMKDKALQFEDLKKKTVWALGLESPDVRLAASPTIAAVYNTVAMQTISIQTGKLLFPNVSFTGTVEAVKCSNNYIAVLKKDTRNISSLYLYDAQGTRLDTLSMGAYTVLDFGFYGEKEKFYTLAINSSGETPICTISTFNTGQSNTGIMPIEGQIVDKLYFDGDASIYAAGTNYLMAFNNVGKETSRRLIYGWKVIDYENESGKPTFLLTPRPLGEGSPEMAIAKIITMAETGADTFVNLPADTLAAYLCGGKVLVVTPAELVQYSLKGELTKRVPLKATVSRAEKLDASRLLLTQGDGIFLVSVK